MRRLIGFRNSLRVEVEVAVGAVVAVIQERLQHQLQLLRLLKVKDQAKEEVKVKELKEDSSGCIKSFK